MIVDDDGSTLSQAIRQLTGLTSLRLSGGEIIVPGDGEEDTVLAAICSAIGSLPALTSLDLSGTTWINEDGDISGHLSNMGTGTKTNLQLHLACYMFASNSPQAPPPRREHRGASAFGSLHRSVFRQWRCLAPCTSTKTYARGPTTTGSPESRCTCLLYSSESGMMALRAAALWFAWSRGPLRYTAVPRTSLQASAPAHTPRPRPSERGEVGLEARASARPAARVRRGGAAAWVTLSRLQAAARSEALRGVGVLRGSDGRAVKPTPQLFVCWLQG
jgi:hypothetical protein